MKRAEKKAKRQREALLRQAAYNALSPDEKLVKDEAVKAKLART